MPFQNSTVVYPINTTTVDTGGAVDIRALSTTEPGATDSSQSCTAPKNSSNSRRFDPATAGDTTALDTRVAQDGKGWGIPLADMDPGDGCSAVLLAQTVTVNMVGTITAAAGGLGNDSIDPRATLWKWDTVANTAVLIGGSNGGGLTFNGITGYTDSAWSRPVNIVVASDVVFGANEILLLVLGCNITASNNVLGAHDVTAKLNVDISTTNVTFTTSLRKRCFQNFVGASTPGGVLVRIPTRVFVGVATPAGGVARQPSRSFVGATVPTGQVAKTPSRSFVGTTTPAGSLRRSPVRLLVGSVAPGPGAVVRRITRVLDGSTTPTSTLNKAIKRFFTGSTSPTGAVLRTPSKFFVGSVTPGPGTLRRRPGKLLQSSLTPTPGTLRTLLTKNFTGTLPSSGAAARSIKKYYVGSTTPTGTVARTPRKFFSGVIAGEGGAATIKRFIRRLVVDD